MRLSNTNNSQSPPIHLAIYHNIYLCNRMNLRSKHHFLDQSALPALERVLFSFEISLSSAIDQRLCLSLVDVLLQNRAVVAKLLDGGFERKESLAWSHAGPACGPQLFFEVVLCYKVLLSANCSHIFFVCAPPRSWSLCMLVLPVVSRPLFRNQSVL